MRSAWDPILVLFIETIIAIVCITGHLEQRYDSDGGKSAKAAPQSTAITPKSCESPPQLPQNESSTSTESTVIMTAFIGKPTDEIVFHVDNVTIVSAEVSNRMNQSIGLYNNTYDLITGKYKISLDSTILSGQRIKFAIKHRGMFRGDTTELYRSYHLNHNDERYEIVGIGIFGAWWCLSPEESAVKYRAYLKDHSAKFEAIAGPLESALELAKYESKRYEVDENRTIERIMNHDNRDDETMPKTHAASTSATEMFRFDTRNPTDYRLPGDLKPFSYEVKIKLADEDSFHGSAKIQVVAMKNTKRIVLHAKEIEVHNVNVKVIDGMLDVVHTEISQYNFFIIHLRQTILKGVSVGIYIDYTGKYNGAKEGFYRDTYMDNGGERRWVAATKFAPIGARRMFPCFDEPRFVTTLSISISRPMGYTAISSLSLDSSEPDSDGSIVDTYKSRTVLHVHLFSLVVGNFTHLISETDGISIWATPNVIDQGEYALNVTVDLANYYNAFFFNANLPMNLQMVALPNFPFGATENCCSWVHRESEILSDPENTSIIVKRALIGVISQEMVYWTFSVKAPPSSWNYVWLTKGFARYFRYQNISTIDEYLRLDAEFVVEQLHAAFESDARRSTRPMTYEVASPAEIYHTFDDVISTAKSASVLRMIEKSIGIGSFFSAVFWYTRPWKTSLKQPDDLSVALQNAINMHNEELNITIKPVMDSWTTQAGYPVVSVKIVRGVAYLEQKRFYSNCYEADTNNNATWWIPITWASGSIADFTKTSPKYWLKERKGEVKLNASAEWVIFNVQQSGYYRVNYDSQSWKRIINVLKSDDRIKIHAINRAGILNDLLMLGQVGEIDYPTALSATQYLINEIDYIPWRAAFDSLAFLNRHFKDDDNFENYKIHFKTILAPIYEKLGLTELVDDTQDDRLLRIYVADWACEFKILSCIESSTQRFAAWKRNSIAVPVNFRKTVYCTAIRYGSSADWNFLWRQYYLTRSATERDVILDGLGCSKLRANVERLLSSAIKKTSPIRSEGSLRAFAAVYSSSSIGTEYALDFVAGNLMDMHKYYQDESSIDIVLNGISSAVTTKKLLLKMENFVETQRETLVDIGLSPEKYLQTAYEMTSWHKRYSPSIYEWLDKTYRRLDFRLPKIIFPRSYDIYLTPYLNKHNSFFDGAITIKMDVTENTFKIVLHADESLEVKNMTAFTDLTEYCNISSYTFNEKTDQLTIYLATEVAAGTELSLQIAYSGVVSDDMYGFHRSSYIDENGKTRWLASTQFEPGYARRAFPCFDEPAFKATFGIHIERPNDYRTLSNMRRLSSASSSSPNRTWDSYEQSVPISSYLVAFVVSDFEPLENTGGAFTVWAPPETVKFGKYALDIGQKVLLFLEQYTGIDKPMEKIDLVAIPNFHSGGMANWGLMTFSDRGLLVNESLTPTRDLTRLHLLLAQQAAHAWFGNLVTCDWWDTVWVQEGLAEYFKWIASDQVSPRWKFLQQFVVYEMHPAMLREALPPHVISTKAVKPSNIAGELMSHGKFASVIRMLRHALGKRVFRTAIRTYLEERKWKTAEPAHLYSAMQLHAGVGTHIETAIKSWTNNRGHPVINATWDANVLSLAQERFVFARRYVPEDRKMDNKFWIPITMTTKSKSNFRNTQVQFWLKNSDDVQLILKKDEWFIINIQATGFYRVNYDVNSWKRIIAGLRSDGFDGIHETNRAQIIDDVFNLARADYVEYDIALSAAKYLVKEDNHLPWAAFFKAIDFLSGRFYKQDVRLLLQEYVLILLTKVYARTGLVDLPDERHFDRLNREMFLRWQCRLANAECILWALKHYKTWRTVGGGGIPPNARSTVYCTLIQHGSSEDWQRMWDEYVNTLHGSEKVIILQALGCSPNETILYNYLKLAISSDKAIRNEDVFEIFDSVLHNHDSGVDVALEFLKHNYMELHSYYGGWIGVANLINRVAPEISQKAQIQELELFINTIKRELGEIVELVLSAIDTARTNLEWTDAHETSIKASLTRILESMNGEEKNSGPILSSNWTFVTVIFYLVFAY